MLNSKQKKSFKMIAVVSLLLSYIALIPFRSFGNSSMIYGIELGVKFLFIPLVLVLLSIKANTMKYRELKVNRYRSKVVNVMSYFPLTVYLIFLLIFTIHTMTISGDGYAKELPLGTNFWNVLFVILIAYICYLIIQIKFISKVILSFSKKRMLQIFDISFIVISVFLIFISGTIVTAYFDCFKKLEFYQKGNALLLIIFIVGYFAVYFISKRIKHSINEDEVLLVTNIGEVNSGIPSELTKTTEYEHALKDILNEFNDYFKNGGKKDETIPVEEPKNDEVIQEEPQTNENSSELKETSTQEESSEEQSNEELSAVESSISEEKKENENNEEKVN